MVRSAEGIDSVRALALAFGLAQLPAARARALALVDVALATDPELATDDLRALRAALAQDCA